MARQMFDNRSSSKQTFVGEKKHEEIDELLMKVLKLTEDLPTSGDRLRTVAGFSLLAMAHEMKILLLLTILIVV